MSEPQSTTGPLIPYATPSPLAEHGDLFRHADILVVRDGITLPESCVICGDPATGQPLCLKFSWDSSFQVARTSTLQLRQAGVIHAWLCKTHRQRWRSGRIMGALGMAASLLLMVASIIVAVISESSDIPRYSPHAIAGLIASFAMFIGFLFLFTLRTRTLKCRRIETGYLYLEGVGEHFLNELPALPRG